MKRITDKSYNLDRYEQEIEDEFDNLQTISNVEKEKASLLQAAKNHITNRKSITVRVRESDLEIMRIKASKLGVPYQTYINMLIHKDATTGI